MPDDRITGFRNDMFGQAISSGVNNESSAARILGDDGCNILSGMNADGSGLADRRGTNHESGYCKKLSAAGGVSEHFYTSVREWLGVTFLMQYGMNCIPLTAQLVIPSLLLTVKVSLVHAQFLERSCNL